MLTLSGVSSAGGIASVFAYIPRVSARESTVSLVAAVAVNLAIAVMKFVAAVIGGSTAMLAEGIHSLVDTGDGLLLLVGLRLSRRPPDELRPFGSGREVYFWSFVVAMIIFALGGGLSIYEGIHRLLRHEVLTHVLLSYLVLGGAFVFESISFYYGWRSFRTYRRELPEANGVWEAIHLGKDPSAFAVVLEDSAALVGLFVAFCGLFFGTLFDIPELDAVASIVIGCLLTAVAALLGYESRGLLIGEAASRRVVRSIRRIVEGHPQVAAVHRVLTQQLGPEEVLVALDLTLCPNCSGDALAQAADQIEGDIRTAHPQVKYVYVDLRALPRRAAAPHDAS